MKLVFESIEIRTINQPLRGNGLSYSGNLKGQLKKLVNNMKLMKVTKDKIKKVFVVMISSALLLNNSPIVAIAQTAPSAPSAPTAPTPPPQPTEPEAPEAPTAPEAPEPSLTPPPAPTAPEAPEAPVSPSSVTSTPTPTPEVSPSLEESSSASNSSSNPSATSSVSDSSNQNSNIGNQKEAGGQTQNGQSGSATIATGDANNVGNISTVANNNLSTSTSPSVSGAGVQVVNSGNGTVSNNTGSVGISDTSNTFQNNSANVGNNLNQETVTGDNSSSMNTGGDNLITTGDANTSGTIVNSVNTNVDALTVYEFNIADDHMGDYVLDLDNATCISGCGLDGTSVKNEGNGAGSTNSSDVDVVTNDNSFQTNDATVKNYMTLVSDSGDNKTNMNTGGDNTIETGDANVSGSVVNMVNNNFSGDVVYAVVNIFGDLVGDIILPDGTLFSCCGGSVDTANTGNGTDSSNTIDVDQNNQNTTSQFNNVDIQNNLVLDAQTGDNDANKNTDGSSAIESGDANMVAQVLNVANTNLAGGNWWLVLVNEAGRWLGKIIGSDGQNYGGSDGFEFVVSDSGEITAVNSGNGSGSQNTIAVDQSNNSNTIQTNNAVIVNDVRLTANTGDNNANMNTGGNNSITTGDANVVASIVNFVNNNIVGSGKLFVSVINVFGSWIGDFVGPGQEKEAQSYSGNGSGIGGSGGGNTQESDDDDSYSASDQTQTSQRVSFADNVFGLFFEGERGSVNVNQSSGSEDSDGGEVAAAVDESGSGPTAGKKVVHINLAWFSPLLPLGILYLMRRKNKARLGSSASVSKAFQS